MKKKIQFEVMFRTEFGIAHDKRKCNLGETPEETFMNAWKSLPKWIDRTKESIDFEQDGNNFHVAFETLRETRFDFGLSVEITELCE
jgi:hypothetical protein